MATASRWIIVLMVALGLWSGAAAAADCPADALGTARVLTVDAGTTPRVGRKHFPQTLPLAAKEVVLTFDDGPWPGTTDRVLDALARECVHATFFLLGRNAVAHPALVRRELAGGHSLGTHTFSHPLLGRMPVAKAEAEIERGIAAVKQSLGDGASQLAPFFRFPGFASNPAILDRLAQRGLVVFGADLWAGDWNKMASARELSLTLRRLEAAGGGIVLFHDTQAKTAAMLPEFLRELRRRGYRVVHVVASGRH